MTGTSNSEFALVLQPLRASLAAWQEWDSELVDAAKLGQIAQQLGFGHFFDDDVHALWRIGLLRADRVTSRTAVSMPGLITVASHEETCYVDTRVMAQRPDGYGSNLTAATPQEAVFTPHFHPYRVYVLHHVMRTLRIETSNCQYLRWTPGVLRVVDSELRQLNHWTGSDSFPDRFDYWNRISEIAAVCQPMQWLPYQQETAPNVFQAWLRDYATSLEGALRAMGLHKLHGYRQDLAMAAHERDGNSNIHTLLRLMKRFERDRIEGRLGAAMKFLGMAESIRRAAERLLQVQMPEEDEIGGGQWMDGARKMLYGHDRVFDAPRKDLRDFLGILGLDFGVKVRCYVEGETELGAFHHAVGAASQCVFVNLKGSVAERGGKGMSFVESLDADMAAHVFSMVVLDADRSDVVRMVRRAASDDRFHGTFTLFDPDIEFGNFTPAELLEVALELVAPNSQARAQQHTILLPAVEATRSGKEFFQRLHLAGVTEVRKGEQWGAALMSFAVKHPKFPPEHPSAGKARPLIDIARTILRAQDAGFLRSKASERLNPETGKIEARSHDAKE